MTTSKIKNLDKYFSGEDENILPVAKEALRVIAVAIHEYNTGVRVYEWHKCPDNVKNLTREIVDALLSRNVLSLGRTLEDIQNGND